MAFAGPGDEVIVLEPYYDSYAASIALAGATRVTVPLRFPEYALDSTALAAAFSPRTRLVLVNSPHNPTGRVLTEAELGEIARLAVAHDTLVVTDEVYEHLVFAGHRHVPMATLPGMADRVISISSAGKTFSVTGWKVGWVTARADLLDAVTTVKQFLTYVNAGPLQPAVAVGLGLPGPVYGQAAARLQTGRDLLTAGLAGAGFAVSEPAGTYFVIADAGPLGFGDGVDLCRRLPDLCGVVAVPVQVFHDDADAARSLVRFAFCKRPEVIEEAVRRLRTLQPG
jgi:N-succinyldiaminopimelate aminotransferase